MKAGHRIGGRASALHYRHPLISCISRFLSCLQSMPDPSARRSVWWSPFKAAMVSVLMVLDRGCSLRERFEDARVCVAADSPQDQPAGKTYNGLVKARQRQAGTILPLLKKDLQRQAKKRFPRLRRKSKWLVLAVDGSKEDMPRTKDNEEHFGIADNGVFPQALMTAIVEVKTGLLWDWRTDRARGSEKDHLVQMAPDLPENTLLVGDGNFVGFPVWSRLNADGKQFLIRVGGNVHLIKSLWPDAETRYEGDIVYVWPKHRRRTSPPLMLRLVQVGSGRKAVYLLTNVLDSRQLPRRDAGEIYRRRWGVELFFRTLKRSLGYDKLLSKAGRRAAIELEWALIAMMIVTMMGLDSASRHRIDPHRLSPAHLIRTLRTFLLRGVWQDPRTGHDCVTRALVSELQDNYERRKPKRSRHRPKTKNTPKQPFAKPPNVRRASAEERRIAKQHRKKAAA